MSEGGLPLRKNNRCGGCRPRCRQVGIILIAVGIGIFLAYIIPYYLLITMLGCALIGLGIRYLCKK